MLVQQRVSWQRKQQHRNRNDGTGPDVVPPALQGTADPLTITAVANCTDPQSESLTTTISWADGSFPNHRKRRIADRIAYHICTSRNVLSRRHFYRYFCTAGNSISVDDAGRGCSRASAAHPGTVRKFSTATLPPGPTNLSVQFVCTSVTDSQKANVKQAHQILGITCTSPVIPFVWHQLKISRLRSTRPEQGRRSPRCRASGAG